MKNIDQLIKQIIDGIKGLSADNLKESCPIGIISMENWEWPQGVALFSMFQYYKIKNNKDVLCYIINWFDKRISEGLPEKNVNTMCPMLTLAYLFCETRNQKYLPLLKEWSNYAMNHLQRTKEGGIQHCVSGILNEGQIWDDTLYMTVLFLAKMGNILNEKAYIDESIYQFLIHIKYLSDTKSGLFFHGFNFNGRHNFANALWARGNSWYTAGLVDYLEIVEIEPSVRNYLISVLELQVFALKQLQDRSGLWHTILNDHTSYLETSASAAFGYGILKGVRKGFISEEYKECGLLALKGVVSMIDANGVVGGVSYGTPVFDTILEYKEIPICPMPYGQSMAAMLLIEGLNH